MRIEIRITKLKHEYGRCNNVRPKTFICARSIIYINVCLKNIRNIYLLTFVPDPPFAQSSVFVYFNPILRGGWQNCHPHRFFVNNFCSIEYFIPKFYDFYYFYITKVCEKFK